jgi:hypothetical protein
MLGLGRLGEKEFSVVKKSGLDPVS